MKKYTLKNSFGSSLGNFAVSAPSAIKLSKNYKWVKNLLEKKEKKNLFSHQKLSLKKSKNFYEIIVNTNYYKSPSFPTVLIKDEKKIRNIYIYTDIWARDFKISNLNEKKIGKFKIDENKIAIYEATYITYINSPDIPKYAKNLKISVDELIKKLNNQYLEIKLDNGIYDVYEISDKKPKLEQQLSLIMSPDDDELDNQLMIGCCLKIKK